MTVFLWVLAVAMMAIGVAGTILPALPGPTLVFAGHVLDQLAHDRIAVAIHDRALLGLQRQLEKILQGIGRGDPVELGAGHRGHDVGVKGRRPVRIHVFVPEIFP